MEAFTIASADGAYWYTAAEVALPDSTVTGVWMSNTPDFTAGNASLDADANAISGYPDGAGVKSYDGANSPDSPIAQAVRACLG
jgi:hypothetical protein